MGRCLEGLCKFMSKLSSRRRWAIGCANRRARSEEDESRSGIFPETFRQ